jgi:hypothetical protein
VPQPPNESNRLACAEIWCEEIRPWLARAASLQAASAMPPITAFLVPAGRRTIPLDRAYGWISARLTPSTRCAVATRMIPGMPGIQLDQLRLPAAAFVLQAPDQITSARYFSRPHAAHSMRGYHDGNARNGDARAVARSGKRVVAVASPWGPQGGIQEPGGWEHTLLNIEQRGHKGKAAPCGRWPLSSVVYIFPAIVARGGIGGIRTLVAQLTKLPLYL